MFLSVHLLTLVVQLLGFRVELSNQPIAQMISVRG
jgi:hypothetical protein